MMICAEAIPFAKTGGLADAVSALSKVLSETHQTIVFMPRYYDIDRKSLNLEISSLRVFDGNEEQNVSIYSTMLEKSNAKVVFVDFEKYFGRKGIYGECPSSAYNDNPLRFSFLCRAAFCYCLKTNWIPDILHCHDWSASFALVLLKFFYKDSYFSNTKGILTIHNLGYQGTFPADIFNYLGLPKKLFEIAGFSHMGGTNFLKAGITCADSITTVSKNYAKEIMTPLGGCTLDGLLRVRSASLSGIVNGVDCWLWNPSTSPFLKWNFSKTNMTGKSLCKKELQSFFKLEENKNIPVISIISRLVSQKGINELFAPYYGCAYKICTSLDIQFVVIGSGEQWCQNELLEFQSKLPNFKVFIGYDEKLSHLVEAGSDFFLMPSVYEPCGLNQIYSQLNGTVPIVRKTGGLVDTVEGLDEDNPTGIFIDDMRPECIFDAVKKAVQIFYKDKELYAQMQKNGMDKDFSWNKSATQYLDVYNSHFTSN